MLTNVEHRSPSSAPAQGKTWDTHEEIEQRAPFPGLPSTQLGGAKAHLYLTGPHTNLQLREDEGDCSGRASGGGRQVGQPRPATKAIKRRPVLLTHTHTRTEWQCAGLHLMLGALLYPHADSRTLSYVAPIPKRPAGGTPQIGNCTHEHNVASGREDS